MEIVLHPNEILRQKAVKITKNDKEVLDFLKDMVRWVKDPENNAVGLALPQIGVGKHGFAYYNGERVEAVLNPIILKKMKFGPSEEGCLSIPGETGIVQRAKEIHVMYFDLNFKPVKKILKGRTACVFQHEYDHLYGILYIDHIEGEK